MNNPKLNLLKLIYLKCTSGNSKIYSNLSQMSYGMFSVTQINEGFREVNQNGIKLITFKIVCLVTC